MADVVKAIVGTFEGLIRRSIAPSVSFFVLLALNDLIIAETRGDSVAEVWRDRWGVLAPSTLTGATGLWTLLALLLVLGLGYTLSAVQQTLFDLRLKADFPPGRLLKVMAWGSARREAQVLQDMRGQVICRLTSTCDLSRVGRLDLSDFALYEILGGIDPTDTRAFVDSAKAIGVVSCSAIVILAWDLFTLLPRAGPWDGGDLVLCLSLLVLAFFFFKVGCEATLSQYRHRAFRLYANFLMMPAHRLKKRLDEPRSTEN
jgi:hypothetical protein